MDWTKETLTPQLIRGLLMQVLPHQFPSPVEEIIAFVLTVREQESGDTLLPLKAATVDRLTPLFHSALSELEEEGLVKHIGDGWWQSLVDPETLSNDQVEARARGEAEAEVTRGEGPESVYGWYLPESRTLAAVKGEAHFPMKVGTTRGEPFQRMKAHIGTAPAKPKLGFLLKTDDGVGWERMVHRELKKRGRHMPEAKGNEWFQTNPAELCEIVVFIAEKLAVEAGQNRNKINEI